MSSAAFDVAVVGSGFAGSLIAMVARRLGRSVILLERTRHPRFAIGESSTPLANLLIEEIAARYALPRIRPLSKWGSWQRAYPNIACGLKRGFSFFHHTTGERFTSDPEHRNQLLVAASPSDEIADTHWYRPDFDHFLVSEAQALGVEYIDECALHSTTFGCDSVAFEGERLGKPVFVRARFVIDASGPRGVLHRALGLPELEFEYLPRTQALFSHFRGVQRLEHMNLFASHERPPYPVDDAAVHHVFDGGWIWVLRFNNGLTSAGVAMRDKVAQQLGPARGRPAWEQLLREYPTIQDQFATAEPELPFTHMPRLSFRTSKVTGPNWALLPSAAGFLDPLLSTGFTLTLLGVTRLAKAIEEHWGRPESADDLARYAQQTAMELLAAERLIAALYASMGDFSHFVPLSLLYFAPVSFAEISRRLDRAQSVASFLLHDHPCFGPRAKACCEDALKILPAGPTAGFKFELLQQVLDAIAPIDVIRLSDLNRRHWYPALNQDLLDAADKLGVDRATMEDFVRR